MENRKTQVVNEVRALIEKATDENLLECDLQHAIKKISGLAGVLSNCACNRYYYHSDSYQRAYRNYYKNIELAVAAFYVDADLWQSEEDDTRVNEHGEQFGVAYNKSADGWFFCHGGGDDSTWCSFDSVLDCENWFDKKEWADSEEAI